MNSLSSILPSVAKIVPLTFGLHLYSSRLYFINCLFYFDKTFEWRHYKTPMFDIMISILVKWRGGGGNCTLTKTNWSWLEYGLCGWESCGPFSIHHLSLVTWGLEGKTKTLIESFMVKYPNINTRFCDCPVLFFTLARYPSHDIVSKKEIMNKSTFKNTIKN